MVDYSGYGGYGAGAPQNVEDAKRRLAYSMMQNAMSTAPTRSWTQGMAQLAQGLMARQMMDRLGPQEATQRNALVDQQTAAAGQLAGSNLGGGAGAGANAAAPAWASAASGLTWPAPGTTPNDAVAPVGGKPPAPATGGVATGGGANHLAAGTGLGMYPGNMNLPANAAGGPPAQSPFPLPPPGLGGSSPTPAAGGDTQAAHEAYIHQRAAQLGIDPNFAVGVANAEGLRALSSSNPNSASVVDRNPDGTPFSFGDFQLNVRNGLGTEARRHGIDPADPRQWQAADDYALQEMARGLGPWRGDAAVTAYQRQGGGWKAPGVGGNALGFASLPPPAPAVGAIDAAAGGAGGQVAPPPMCPTPRPAGCRLRRPLWASDRLPAFRRLRRRRPTMA